MGPRVEVWRIALDDPAAACEDVLDDEDRARAEAFQFPRDRRRFRVAHVALRQILSGYGLGAPQALRFDQGPHGKPTLRGSSVRFNLSHSGERALLAVCERAEVGVDVEAVRELHDLMGSARLVFHPDEIAELGRLRTDERRQAFFECWARREAYLKGLGLGLGAAKRLPPVWRTGCSDTSPQPGWTVVGLRAEAGFQAALAVQAGSVEVVDRSWIAPSASR